MPGSLSNYPPGVSGNEPQIAGTTEFYLRCTGCGEVFDSIDTASEHALDGLLGDLAGPETDDCDNTWEIVPEGVAF